MRPIGCRNATHHLPQRKTKKAHPKAGFSISKLTESYSPFLALQMLILAAPESQIQENGGNTGLTNRAYPSCLYYILNLYHK